MTNIQLQQDFGLISMELRLGDSLDLHYHFWDLPDHFLDLSDHFRDLPDYFPGSFGLRESEASAKKHSAGTEINPLTRIGVKSSNFFTILAFLSTFIKFILV